MQGRTGRARGGRWGILGLALATAAIGVLACAATARAAPPADTISENDLNTLLQGGPVSGYFETILGGPTLADQQPVQIPVTVQGIVPGNGATGDLILFQASGSQIDAIGGTAEGMSGSPLYVDDGSGTPKLAGAVSQTDIFTKQNLGLATPIDDMTALEATYFGAAGLTRRLSLSPPVITPTGAVTKVLIAPNRAAAAKLHPAAGTAVMVPLTTLQVNGLIPGSAVYKKLAAKFSALGFDLTPRSAGPALSLPPLPPLTGGSSLGVMYSDGDFAFGALGTVTYVDPDNDVVVAFGHPFDYAGTTSLDLTSAWVQGIWSDSVIPYKVMSPVDVVGAITQDRGAGVVGQLGATPIEVPITSQATLGAAIGTAASTATQWVVDNPMLAGLPSAAVAVAMQKVTDTGFFPGSAVATAKIDVSDGNTTYHIERTDLWNDPFDVMSVATGDIDNALATLTSGLPGLSPKVTSIDFSADLSATDRSATIEDVTAPGGLHHGANDVTVTLLAASGEVVDVPVTLVIPGDASTSGTLDVFAATGGGGFGSGFGAGPGLSSPHLKAGAAGRADVTAPTLAQVVADINGAPKNTDLDLIYTPDNQGAVVQPVEVLKDTTDRFVEGEVVKRTGRLHLHVSPKTVDYGGRAEVTGMIEEADGSTTVRLYERQAGQSGYTLVIDKLPAELDNSGAAFFGATITGLKKKTTVKVVWDGDADHLAQTATVNVAVKAHVALDAVLERAGGRASVEFVVTLKPKQTGGHVRMQRLVGTHWSTFATLKATATPVIGLWKPAPGSYKLRAVFMGSTTNAGATSPTKSVTVP